MVKLVHNKSQIHSLHTGVISPGFPQGMGTVISSQPNIITDRNDELPGLPASNGFSEITRFGVEEKEMLGITGDIGVNRKILPEYFPDTGIDKDIVAFAPFLLFDSETLFDGLSIIHEMTDLQTQEIRNPQCGVDPHCE